MAGDTATMITLSATTRAAGLMALSMLLFSTLPLLIALVGTDSPFLFAAALEIGRVAILVAAMIIAYRKLFLDGRVWRLALRRSRSRTMFLWAAAQWNYALFAWSAGLVGVAITTALFQTWHVLLVVIIGNLFRAEARYRAVGGRVYLAFALAAFGAGVVVMSQSGAWNAAFGDRSALDLRFAIGILLAFAAAGLAAMSAYGFRWAVDFANELPSVAGRYESHSARPSERSLELFGVFLGFAITNLIAAPFMMAVGLVRHEPIAAAAVPLTLAVTLVALVDTAASTTWRISNLMTERLGVNVISHFAPPLSLGILILFGHVGDVNLPLLLMGAVIIVVANIMVFFQTRATAQTRPSQPKDV